MRVLFYLKTSEYDSGVLEFHDSRPLLNYLREAKPDHKIYRQLISQLMVMPAVPLPISQELFEFFIAEKEKFRLAIWYDVRSFGAVAEHLNSNRNLFGTLVNSTLVTLDFLSMSDEIVTNEEGVTSLSKFIRGIIFQEKHQGKIFKEKDYISFFRREGCVRHLQRDTQGVELVEGNKSICNCHL